MTVSDTFEYLRTSCYFTIANRRTLWGPQAARYLFDLVRSYPAWTRLSRTDASPIQLGLPWMTFSAIAELGRFLTSRMRAFEYGTGGSTIFLSERVDELVSVEHDPQWLEIVADAMARHKTCRWSYVLREPVPEGNQADPASPESYASSEARYAGASFREYVSAVDSYPDRYFDLILIDGRARPSCLPHAIPKLKGNGLLVLDDSHRTRYARAREILTEQGWSHRPCFGPGPAGRAFRGTSIWSRCPD